MAFDRKYKLLKRDVTYVNIHHQTIKLYRIMALKRIVLCNGEVIDEGMLGGYIQKEENLSQIGTCKEVNVVNVIAGGFIKSEIGC